MGASLAAPGTSAPSSYGQPLQPVTLPGTLQVPFGEVTQFLRGFPPPPGVPDVVNGVNALITQAAQGFASASESGDVARVVQAVIVKSLELAPAVVGGIGGLVSASGLIAGIAGPFTAGIPYVGGALAAGLEIYAPLAAIGGQGAAGISTAAQMAQRAAAAYAAQQQAAQPPVRA